MNVTQILLVQNSWRLLRGLDPQLVGSLFYSKLFFDHAELRKLFPADITEQQAKLISKFNIVIARLDHFQDLLPEMEALGQRHVIYGVKPEHYAAVGAALLWTLERGLGDDWTPQVAHAWKICYEALSTVMIKASGQ